MKADLEKLSTVPVITPSDRDALATKLFSECLMVLKSKGASYAGVTDANANFKRNAERIRGSKYVVWQVYWNKHVDAINAAIGSSPDNPPAGECGGESLRSRMIDTINYIFLLEAMLAEDRMRGEAAQETEAPVAPVGLITKLP
jgi:hypothetical protein